jgi:hypothetical protein
MYLSNEENHMTYTFDIAHDCPLSDFLEMLEDHNLKLESFTAFGPAGGNPEITVSGSESDIKNLQATLYVQTVFEM